MQYTECGVQQNINRFIWNFAFMKA